MGEGVKKEKKEGEIVASRRLLRTKVEPKVFFSAV